VPRWSRVSGWGEVPASGIIEAVNDAVQAKPGLINGRPPTARAGSSGSGPITGTDSADLKTGQDALTAFEAKMAAEGFGGC
jgi:glycine cleavage system H protein